MKRFIVLVFAMFTVSVASAQNLIDAFKGVATQIVDKATDGKVSEILLTGDWNYSAPAVRFVKDGDLLADVTSALVTEGLSSRLTKAYNFVGIKQGASSFTFNNDDTFTAVFGKRTLQGTYTYDSATHKLTLEFSALLKVRQLNGYAYINGDTLDLVFDCSKFMDFLVSLGSKTSLLKGVSTIAAQYDSMMIGFQYAK